jgi:hypothetical protein
MPMFQQKIRESFKVRAKDRSTERWRGGCLVLLLSFGWGSLLQAQQSERVSLCKKIVDTSISMSEQQAVRTLGQALFYEGHPALGVTPTTACLFSMLYGPDAATSRWSGEWISSALLELMTLDPSDWFKAAAKADPLAIQAWFRKPLLASQLRPLGACPVPDKFAVALKVIGGLRFPDHAEEDLRVRLVQQLSSLRCET